MLVVAGRRGNIVFGQVDVAGGQNNGDILVAENATLEIREIGGTGTDIVKTDIWKDAGMELEGRFLFRQDGSEGNDTVTTKLKLDSWSDGTLEGEQRGGNNDDKVYLVLDDYSHAITWVSGKPKLSLVGSGYGVDYGVANYFLQDGGSGKDNAFTEFNNTILGPGDPSWSPIRRRNFENILLSDPT
jgi:hypothetical protein